MDIIISDSCMFWHYPSISVVCAVTHFRSYRMFLRVLVQPFWPMRYRIGLSEVETYEAFLHIRVP